MDDDYTSIEDYFSNEVYLTHSSDYEELLGNNSRPELSPRDPTELVLMYAFNAVIVATGIVLNLVLVKGIIGAKSNGALLFVLQIALIDVLTLLTCNWELYYYIRRTWIFSKLHCTLYSGLESFTSVAVVYFIIGLNFHSISSYNLAVELSKNALATPDAESATETDDSLITGQFPNTWKESIVIPIPKINGTIIAEEFRPINMLNTLEKILELVVKEQLVQYLKENKLLVPEQSGYRESHSCETALNLVLEKWKTNLNKKHITLAVFLDLKRAFETISRPLLINALKNFGIVGQELDWFKNYLEGRTQRTRFKTTTSESLENSLGVPQGSVLGPILFIMYINDMKNVLKFCDINLFADDTVVFLSCSSVKEATTKLNEDLASLDQWLKYKKLKLNAKKTKMLVLSRTKTLFNLQINIDDEAIERVKEIKYLGVTIDEELKFKSHIDDIIKKMAKKYGIICRLKKDLSVFAKIQLYKSLMAPHLDFCPSILFMANAGQMTRMQKLQNRAMRAILGCGWYTSSLIMLDTLKWMSVKQRVMYQTMIFVYKLLNSHLPQYLCDRVVRGLNVHDYNTRRAADPRVPKVETASAMNSLFFKGIQTFNMMPRVVCNAETIPQFKRLCATHIKATIV